MKRSKSYLTIAGFWFRLSLLAGLLLLMVLAGSDFRSVAANRSANRPHNPKVLYVPLDNRPINYRDVLSLAEIAGVELLTPPAEILGQDCSPGDTGALMRWLKDNSHRGDAWVLSWDMLLYGGLAPSRFHNKDVTAIVEQIEELQSILKEARAQGIPVYVLATAMRSAASSASPKQPGYFAQYGDQIFYLSQLSDLADLGQISPEQEDRLEKIRESIPPVVLANYLNRRDINLMALEEAVYLTEEGFITYLVVGRDDTTPHSFTQLEMRWLTALMEWEKAGERVDSYPGADELGGLLLARAVNHLEQRKPKIYVDWDTPWAPYTIASFEDISLGDNVELHIKSGGGEPVKTPRRADLVLVMNTMDTRDRGTPETELQLEDNFEGVAPLLHHRELACRVAEWQHEGKPVAVADVAYANSSDQALMAALEEAGVLPGLVAYAGCNTAGNSLGLALAQGLLWNAAGDAVADTVAAVAEYNPEDITENAVDPAGNDNDTPSETKQAKAQRQCLLTRLGKDWGYQTIIRPALVSKQPESVGIGTALGTNTVRNLERKIKAGLDEFFRTKISPFFKQKMKIISVTLPWKRLFEIDLQLEFN